MSASVRRRIERNIRERETGHRSPLGRGRFRGLNPVECAAAEESWANALKTATKAEAMTEARERMRREYSEK